MKRTHTYGGYPTTRNLTIADIKAGKRKRKFFKTTAVNRIETATTEATGIDHLSVVDHDLVEMRAGAPNTIATAALMATEYETRRDVLPEVMDKRHPLHE